MTYCVGQLVDEDTWSIPRDIVSQYRVGEILEFIIAPRNPPIESETRSTTTIKALSDAFIQGDKLTTLL